LDQKYYLESKLGTGGMGTVYCARRLLIGDSVAVKVLHPDQVADPKAVERFRREAQTAARLKHPNVVTIYDFGVSRDSLIYLVMELAEGESLRRLIQREGTLPEDFVAEIVRQTCAALDEAHRQGVVHRDIKPENILVQRTPGGAQVKVLDFGIAALRDITASRLTRTGGIVGTPHYMSPEHCLGEKLDGRSDIYSLGIVMFEMLTGVAPFDSTTPTAVVIQQVNQAPPPPRTLNPDVSPAVEAVVLRALEKQREARPQTAGELARELMAAVDQTAVISPRPTAPTPPGAPTLATELAPVEVAAPASGSDMAPATEGVPAFAVASARTGSNSKPVLLIFGALLLVAGLVGGGLWLRQQRAGGAGGSAGSGDQTPSQSSQSSVQAQNAANLAPATPTPSNPPPKSDSIWEVIADQTTGATNAANALGAADQQMAVIGPGGQLALNYHDGQFFGDGQGADLRVYGPEGERISYLIFVRNDPAAAWERIDVNRSGFSQGVAGHDIGHHGVRRARQVVIKNNGNADLKIDAVAVVYKDKAYVVRVRATESRNKKRRQ
jgi:serine/threonine-protein kinase